MVSGTNFLTGILLARFLGMTEFGVFSLTWMAVLFAGSLQHAAIVAPMMSIGPERTGHDTRFWGGAMLAQQIAFSGISFALLYWGAQAFGRLSGDWRAGDLAPALACAAVAVQMQDFVRRYLFSRERPAAAFASDAVSYPVRIAVLLVAFHVARPASGDVLWIIAATSAVAAALGCAGLGRLSWRREVFIAVTARHWRSTRWLLPSALLQWFAGNLFLVAAGALLGPAAVGALRAAQNVMGVTHVLVQGLENVAPVQSARQYREGGLPALRVYMTKLAWLCMAMVAAVGVPAWVFAEFWLDLIYAGEYGSHGGLLRWYVLVYLVMFAIFPLRIGLRAVERTRPLFLAYVAAAGATCLTVYPLTHLLGLSGVMAGTLATQIVMLLVLWVAWRRHSGE